MTRALLTARPGDLVDVRIGDVHPTQPSLGYDEVYYKLGRYSRDLSKDAVNKQFSDWCELNGQTDVDEVRPGATLRDPSSFSAVTPLGQETDADIVHMKTVVIGPGGRPYLTDGHHSLTAFAETADGGPDTRIRLRVLGNLSELDDTDFWAEMRARKWVWVHDVRGDEIDPRDLPTSVGLHHFEDDPARSIMYFGRHIGYAPDSVPFQEFYWDAWLRSRPEITDLSTWNQNDMVDSLARVKAITKAQARLSPRTVVHEGFTAADLGVLDEWNEGRPPHKGEFAKLSAPYESVKPGRLAYMTAYRLGHPVLGQPVSEQYS